LGVPHVEFTQPFRSHEIDFLLYDAAGKSQAPKEPVGGWKSLTADQSICVFETTVGHHSEQDRLGKRASLAGHDHPKNKLLNYLALRQTGFKQIRFHYLAILGFGKQLSPATVKALTGTQGFSYWSLSDVFPDSEDALLHHLDTPVSIADFRSWHEALIMQVEAAAKDWAGCP